jgi:hypothetical protein
MLSITKKKLATTVLTSAVSFAWLINRVSGWLYYDANMEPWCPSWLAELGARGVDAGEALENLIDRAAARAGIDMLDVLAPIVATAIA